jgi:hypothetical protein
MQHQFIEGCEDQCGACNLCCLSICKVCGFAEGELTTDCPGVEKISEDKRDLIYAGKLDYQDGKGWVEEPNPCNQQKMQF